MILIIIKFCELLLRISPRIINSFEKLYQTLERVFPPISKHLEVGLKKLGCASFFQPTSRCFEIGGNTLPRVSSITSMTPLDDVSKIFT